MVASTDAEEFREGEGKVYFFKKYDRDHGSGLLIIQNPVYVGLVGVTLF